MCMAEDHSETQTPMPMPNPLVMSQKASCDSLITFTLAFAQLPKKSDTLRFVTKGSHGGENECKNDAKTCRNGGTGLDVAIIFVQELEVSRG